jgi:hypothetical protein
VRAQVTRTTRISNLGYAILSLNVAISNLESRREAEVKGEDVASYDSDLSERDTSDTNPIPKAETMKQ